MMWRIIIAIVLIMHGVGHVMGIFSVFGLFKSQGLSSRSWLLSDILGNTATTWFSLVLWLVALLGFFGAGFGLLDWLVSPEWWRPLAIVAAATSLVGIILFWDAFFVLMNKVGAISVDVAVLMVLLWVQWPLEAVLSS